MLASQKLQSSRQPLLLALRVLILAGFVLSLCYGTYFAAHTIQEKAVQLPLHVTVLPAEQINNPQELAHTISKKITGSRSLLRETVKQEQIKLAASGFHIFHKSINQVVVQFHFYQAVACVQLDQKRKVSQSGKVFDKCNASEGLPTILGLPSPAKPNRYDDQSLVLSGQDQSAIQNALTLLAMANSAGWRIAEISHRSFQGFEARFKDPNILVAFGEAPYEPQFQKLEKVLAAGSTQLDEILRIELDYQDKVFVKKKTL